MVHPIWGKKMSLNFVFPVVVYPKGFLKMRFFFSSEIYSQPWMNEWMYECTCRLSSKYFVDFLFFCWYHLTVHRRGYTPEFWPSIFYNSTQTFSLPNYVYMTICVDCWMGFGLYHHYPFTLEESIHEYIYGGTSITRLSLLGWI